VINSACRNCSTWTCSTLTLQLITGLVLQTHHIYIQDAQNTHCYWEPLLWGETWWMFQGELSIRGTTLVVPCCATARCETQSDANCFWWIGSDMLVKEVNICKHDQLPLVPSITTCHAMDISCIENTHFLKNCNHHMPTETNGLSF
jgi:hypothetical protein